MEISPLYISPGSLTGIYISSLECWKLFINSRIIWGTMVTKSGVKGGSNVPPPPPGIILIFLSPFVFIYLSLFEGKCTFPYLFIKDLSSLFIINILSCFILLLTHLILYQYVMEMSRFENVAFYINFNGHQPRPWTWKRLILFLIIIFKKGPYNFREVFLGN